MNTLKRNRRTFWYAHYAGVKPIINEDGYETGEHKVTYTNPVKCKGNISTTGWSISHQPYGNIMSYDRVIMLGRNPGIDDSTVLWIDTVPEINPDGSTSTPHDHIAGKRPDGFNHTTIFAKKVVLR